jgi:hypothetical protein
MPLTTCATTATGKSKHSQKMRAKKKFGYEASELARVTAHDSKDSGSPTLHSEAVTR